MSVSLRERLPTQSTSKRKSDPSLHIDADNIVGHYLHELAVYPQLNAHDEQELGKKIHEGKLAHRSLPHTRSEEERQQFQQAVREGVLASETLVQHNLRLVIPVAKQFKNHGVPFPDLIQEGNFGLMRAAQNFDYLRGNKFSSYANTCIRRAITQSLNEQGDTIRIPRPVGILINKMHLTELSYEQTLERKPTDEELAQSLGVKPKKIGELRMYAQKTRSLDESAEDNDNDGILLNNAPRDTDVSDENVVLNRILVASILATLSPRDAQIVNLTFGTTDGISYHSKEIGKAFGIARQRVNQIVKKFRKNLQESNAPSTPSEE